MATTQILFIRHGETAWNRIKRIQGHVDIPLADSGLAQAQRLAVRLAREAREGSASTPLFERPDAGATDRAALCRRARLAAPVARRAARARIRRVPGP
jgi:broad specificity phosphatase PhoE